ncbi:hypothetical protein FPV67DRAFT_1524145, partial [Lyophyllum atratum]
MSRTHACACRRHEKRRVRAELTVVTSFCRRFATVCPSDCLHLIFPVLKLLPLLLPSYCYWGACSGANCTVHKKTVVTTDSHGNFGVSLFSHRQHSFPHEFNVFFSKQMVYAFHSNSTLLFFLVGDDIDDIGTDAFLCLILLSTVLTLVEVLCVFHHSLHRREAVLWKTA